MGLYPSESFHGSSYPTLPIIVLSERHLTSTTEMPSGTIYTQCSSSCSGWNQRPKSFDSRLTRLPSLKARMRRSSPPRIPYAFLVWRPDTAVNSPFTWSNCGPRVLDRLSKEAFVSLTLSFSFSLSREGAGDLGSIRARLSSITTPPCCQAGINVHGV